MPAIGQLNPLYGQRATVNAGRGTGSAVDQQNNVTARQTTVPNTAPAKADAIRKPTLVSGLVDALNQFQENISGPEDSKSQLYPDKYQIIIVDEEIASAQVIPPGETNLKQVPMTQAQTANQQKNPATQKVDNNAKTSKILPGTNIVQFLDQVIRTSTYITEQQTAIYNAAQQKLLPNGTPAQTVGWYRIGLEATPQLDKFDTKRGDYAYNITYQINIYAVSNVKSDFFPSPQFRGVQKRYLYWFTGENTQILDFSQDFNYLYYITSNGPRLPVTSNYREIEKRYYTVRSSESSQGQDNDVVNEASANAADYLYSPGNQGRLKMKIVGDPAWIFQGELWSGVQGLKFNYGPFLPDGTINIEGQESMFEVAWNMPVDYDLETGIADPTTKNYNKSAKAAGDPSETFIYKAIKCVSSFSRGKFEQELEGALQIYPLEDKTKNDAQRVSVDAFSEPSAFALGPDQSDAETRRLQAGALQARFSGKTFSDRQQQAAITAKTAYRDAFKRNPAPLTADSLAAEGFTTAPADQPPTSGGQVIGTAATPTSLFGVYGATGQGTGNPVVTFTTQTGRVVTASSDQDIKDAFNAGFINKVTQNNLTRQLNSLQQQANSPTTSAPRQIIRRET